MESELDGERWMDGKKWREMDGKKWGEIEGVRGNEGRGRCMDGEK